MTDISFQLYSARSAPDLAATLKMLAATGYTQVEGYGALYADATKVEAVQAALAQTGLKMPSGHFSLDMLENSPDRVCEIAGKLDISRVFCPHIGPGDRPADAAGWRDFGARLEKASAPIRDAGLAFGWHNHDFEFAALDDGSTPMEHILAGGPDLEWEADIAWIIRGGGDPLAWIDGHGARITAVHVKDIAPQGECADEDGWADVGHGTVDWAALVAALARCDVKLWVAEHDKPSDPERFARRSYDAISKLLGGRA
ncbi:TIM barrel protein [Rhodobacteraceae bacterium 2CG4]|uniref:TIM barrel protein n=1 Tax=Halovulum marinum TaxID=2662447 RepID=A0A6L5Z115_9RHOB|nr:sugar phosphate isomerase/epimerase [Halovulum marinum]MSU90188.1 TIM barrel protein [Halovulum marinum]